MGHEGHAEGTDSPHGQSLILRCKEKTWLVVSFGREDRLIGRDWGRGTKGTFLPNNPDGPKEREESKIQSEARVLSYLLEIEKDTIWRLFDV